MIDLVAVGGYSATHLVVQDYVVKKHFSKLFIFCICVTFMLFCVFVLSVFFATKIIAFLNRAPKWELIKSRIAIKNN